MCPRMEGRPPLSPRAGNSHHLPSLSVRRLPLREPSVEERRSQLSHRLVGAHARVERHDRREAVGGRGEDGLAVKFIERGIKVLGLQRLEGVVVHLTDAGEGMGGLSLICEGKE